ncbi:protein unc-93 homolog A [Euwallacea similis]|uniref:protein unc-93 homolog A n=1 Tax=Euwallacea similis TaxID=1736056 RepID=UPI00344D1347
MGSLPNLHELGRNDDLTDSAQMGFKPGLALGRLCGAYNSDLTNEEKSRILHRYSGHAKITKVRSNPHDSHKVVHDELMMEHMAAYSPISSRSRYNLHMQTGGPIKRIDSMASSIGATSVRRLLTVVRGGNHNSSLGRPAGIAYSRRVLILNLVIMCFCHLLSTAAFLPFLSLQSSVSVWVRSLTNAGFEFNTGSLLSSEMFLVGAVSALVAPCLIRIVGITVVVAFCYAGMAIFYAAHILPVIYATIPASLLLGILLGLLSSAHISFLMILTHRIAGLFHEDDEDGRYARRTCVIRRVARAFQGAHDVGLILGSVASFVIIHFTINMGSVLSDVQYQNATASSNDCYSNSTTLICSNQTQPITISASSPYDYNSFLDDIFDRTEDGRLCGAQACPIFLLGNSSLQSGFKVLPVESSKILIGVYGGACGLAFLLSALGLDSIRTLTYQDPLERGLGLTALRAIKDSFRDPRLQLTAPLAVFMGMEQAFIYSDFAKSYVVCTLGIHRLNLVFFSMGLLQSIAACTLSMLLRTIRRYYVVAVGFAFQICLIMVLLLWKPIEDDPALFYVISAAWGVCHAIWEMISFTLLTGQYLDHWEAAFANRAFFKFLGFSLAFVFHSFLCNYMKLYLLAFVMVVSVVPFALLEYRLENIRKIRNITRL